MPFEPGSVFKVITLSAALETTDLKPSTMINCGNGSFTMAGRTVHEAHHGYGTMPMEMVLAKSSNIGAIQIGLKVGSAKLYEYVRRFGLGGRTGIPLPAESPGIVRKLSKWRTTSLMSVSMGHEVGVTTLQLAQACSVVANGGLLVPPRLILKRGTETVPVVAPHRILRPETAIMMRKMMEGVVLYGTGKKYANLKGYSSAGKTGSAQIFDYATGHYTHSYNASFMGFAPVANPAIVVVVTVNKTKGGSAGYGGPVAGPVFREVMTEALRVLDVPRDLPDTPDELEAKAGEPDAPATMDGPQDPPDVEEAEAAAPETPKPPVYGPQLPPAPPAVQVARESGPRAPNLIGLSMRSVAIRAQAQGLPVVDAGHRHRPQAGPAARRRPAWRRKDSSRSCQMTLGEILSGVRLAAPLSPFFPNWTSQGLDYDSRRVQPGFLFFAFPGSRADGRQFAHDAVARGAVAVASESAAPDAFPAPWIEVEHGRQALALAARNFYRHPDERIALTGITGTNGKTTTSYLIDAILRAAGKTTALIGTIEYHLAGRVLPAVNTTPESLDLLRLFAELEAARRHRTR